MNLYDKVESPGSKPFEADISPRSAPVHCAIYSKFSKQKFASKTDCSFTVRPSTSQAKWYSIWDQKEGRNKPRYGLSPKKEGRCTTQVAPEKDTRCVDGQTVEPLISGPCAHINGMCTFCEMLSSNEVWSITFDLFPINEGVQDPRGWTLGIGDTLQFVIFILVCTAPQHKSISSRLQNNTGIYYTFLSSAPTDLQG